MNPSLAQPNEVLRDIHLPDAISWWPPAIGWWILLILIIATIIFIPKLYHYLTFVPFNKVAKNSFDDIVSSYEKEKNSYNFVVNTSKLLRQIAMTYYGRQEVAHITGDKWIDSLNNIVEKEMFSDELKYCLMNAPYQNNISIDAESLISTINDGLSSLPNKVKGHSL